MGYEYVSAAKPDDACIASVQRALSLDPRYEVLSSTETGIALRLVRQPARDRWPEDLDVYFRPVLRVVFHSATRNDRNDFLKSLQSLLAGHGHDDRFEED
ncbi:hypothetical protein [Chondromyces crocatus]|uniref:Uncharacterized protein n=1 Tax=Chondromyces crocatus TaxID=52 RepID=A0A0K1EQ52_CHOCO|nr:hypothetical protein [Chondromyces crocatus]AKT42944.1 uncharacterized protein CMC5_071720 [Chondromyces crocatus]